MKMKCGCVNNNGQQRSMKYERFHNLPTLAELGVDVEDKYEGSENEEELVFYNEDNTYQTVVVVHKLRASDLCQILAMKNRVRKDCNWSIVEHWIDIGLERTIEDHEDILQVFKHMESYPKPISKKFVFRKDFRKYEMFINPQKFFPSEMVDLSGFPGATAEDVTSPESLQAMVIEGESCPPMFGQVWVRDPNSLLWAKAYLLLKEKKLYLSYKVQSLANFIRNWNNSGIEPMTYENDTPLRKCTIQNKFLLLDAIEVPSVRINLKLHGANPLTHKSVARFNELPANIGETNFGIGVPISQRLTLQFDTASDGVWVFSTLYHTCDPNYAIATSKMHTLWNETASVSYHTVSPRRLVSVLERGDEWVFGYHGYDRVAILNIYLDNIWFVQALKASKVLASIEYDGIFGLKYDPKKGNLLSKICGKIQGSHMFSVHYPRTRTINSDFSDGVLTLCGDDKSKYNANSMTYVDSLDPGTWRVKISKISVRDTKNTIDITSHVAAILDTTSNRIEGPANEIEKIYAHLRNHSVPQPDTTEFECFKVHILPAIIFSMGGFEYSIQGYDYSYEVQVGKSKGCRILIQSHPSNYHWTLGEPFFRKYYAKFDMDNHRVGLAENKPI